MIMCFNESYTKFFVYRLKELFQIIDFDKMSNLEPA